MSTESMAQADSRTVVITSDLDDFVARRASALRAAVLHVDDLCECISTRPWPEVLKVDLPDYFKAAVRGAYVINRIFSLAGTKVASRLKAEGIDERWFHIRIQPLLELADCLAHDTGTRGVSRTLLPLDAQWFEIKRVGCEVSTPDFIRGRGRERPNVAALREPIQKSAWSLFEWKEERSMTWEESQDNQFYVSRPTGIPVIAWYLGRSVHGFHCPGKTAEIDQVAIRAISSKARAAFRSDAGEMLLFLDGRTLCFHAFSPLLATVERVDGVAGKIDGWIMNGRRGAFDVSR